MQRERSQALVFETSSERETLELGEALGRNIESGVCLSLQGPLGSGKSVLARGICRGLGVGEDVVSPTFILLEEYRGRLPVIHVDFYRLDLESEIEGIGLFDRIDGRTVVVAEWGDRSQRLLAIADVVVALAITGPTARRIDVSAAAEMAHVFEGLR